MVRPTPWVVVDTREEMSLEWLDSTAHALQSPALPPCSQGLHRMFLLDSIKDCAIFGLGSMAGLPMDDRLLLWQVTTRW